MPQNSDPFRHLTLAHQHGLENTPEVMAMRAGDYYIPQTWGSLASAAVEAGIVEPSVEAVCDFFSIEPEALNMPDVVIETHSQVNGLHYKVTNGKKEQFAREQGGPANDYKDYLLAALEEYKIEDPSTAKKYNAFQQAVSACNEIQQMDPNFDLDEWDRLEQESGLLRLKRNAIISGTVVSLEEFAEVVFSFVGEDKFFTDGELASALYSVVSNTMDEYHIREPEAVPTVHVAFGQNEINSFFRALQYTFMRRIEDQVEERWHAVLDLITVRGEDHPAIAGTEN